MNYQRAAVASTFSPTFAAVLAEAEHFARSYGADLHIVHASNFDAEKERRFFDAMRRRIEIRWAAGETPARAILDATTGGGYELLIAGALQKEDSDRHFTNGVARELLRATPCDLLLLPHPSTTPPPVRHVVFAVEPGQDMTEFLKNQVRRLRPQAVTITATHTPFAAAIAASRGEEPANVEEWLENLAVAVDGDGVEVETSVVTSNTGYSLCDFIQGLEPDLLVVKMENRADPLPAHMNWLYQVIPSRLLAVREENRA
jgi:nucleotide-binding universal stress UspA family protein